PYSGANNASNTTPANVFQTVGAGGAYLLPDSPLRRAGTTNINASLLSDLRGRTTFPPVVFDNVTISIPTTFSPVVSRDTGTPDLGWHYSPIDVAVNTLVMTNADLIINPGTVVATYGDQ